jgi:tetratricopeptide (TPR) repeat protein
MKRVAVLLMLVLWATGCATGPSPKEVMGKYLDAYGKGNYEEAYPLLSSSDKAAKSLDAFSESEESEFMAILGPKVSYQVKGIKTEGKKAKATVEIEAPDIKGVFGELLGKIMAMVLGGEQDDKALEKMLAERVQGKNWPTTTRTEYYDLVKEQDGWKVFLNYEGIDKSQELKNKAEILETQKKYSEAKSALEEATKLNPKDTEIPGKIKAMDKKATEYNERKMYFDKIEVRNVSVEPNNLGQLGVFGEVKNRGDRTLRAVAITVYYLDKEGNGIHEKTYFPVLATGELYGDNQPLKPNYGRTFWYRVDRAPSDWAKKVKVAVTDVEFHE